MQTPDGYWRVEVYWPRGSTKEWFRIVHGNTVVHDKTSIATVQRILGHQFAELEPIEAA